MMFANSPKLPIIRFQIQRFLFLFLLVSVLSSKLLAQSTFYSQATGSFGTLTNWDTNPVGGGVDPVASDLTNGLNHFIIQDGHAITLNGAYTISSLVVGQGLSGSLLTFDNANGRALTIATTLLVNTGASIATQDFTRTSTISVAGDITIDGTFDLYFDANSITNLVLNGGVNQNLLGSSASIDLNTLTVNVGTTFTLLSQTINVYGLWTNNGTISPGTSIVNFAGATQTVNASTFFDIEFSGAGAKTLNPLTINNDLIVSNTSGDVSITSGGDYLFNVLGNVEIRPNASLVASTANRTNSLQVAGHVTVDGSLDLYYDSNSRVNLAFDTNVGHLLNGTPTFFQLANLTLNVGSGSLTTSYGLDVEQSVTINTGSELLGGTFMHTIAGNWTNSGTFTHNTSTVNFDGGTQTIGSSNFYNLELSTLGTKNLGGDYTIANDLRVTNPSGSVALSSTIARNILVQGDLVVNALASLTVSNVTATHLIQIEGDLEVNGIFDLYTDSGSKIDLEFSTNSAHQILGTPVLVDLASLSLATSSGSLTPAFDLTINDHVTINNSSELVGGANLYTVRGNWTNLGTFTSNTSTVRFDGGTQSIGESNFYNLEFSASGTKTLSGNYIVDHNLLVSSTSGNVSLSSATARTFTVANDFVVNALASLNVSDVTATHLIQVRGNVQVNGSLDLYLDSTSKIDIEFQTNAVHQFNGNPTLLELASLVLATNSGSLEPLYPLLITEHLTINSSSEFIAGAHNHQIRGNWSNSGTFTNTGSTITFTGLHQTIGNAEVFDNLILSSTADTGIKTFAGDLTVNGYLEFAGSFNTELSTANFNVLVAGDLINSGGIGDINTITHTSGLTTVAGNVVSNAGGSLRLNGNLTAQSDILITNNSIIRIGGSANSRTISVLGDLDIELGSSFLTIDNQDYTHIVEFNGDVIINGVFDLYLDATSQTIVRMNGNVPHAFSGSPSAIPQFYDLVLNSTSNTTTVGYGIDLEGSVTIEAGSTLEAGTFTHTVAGNWTNNGTFSNGTSNIRFDGTTQSIGTSNFYNLEFSVTGTKTIQGNLQINNNVLVSAGTSTISAVANRVIEVFGDFTVNLGASWVLANVPATHQLTLHRNLTINGNFDLYLDADSRSDLSFASNFAHLINGSPTGFELSGFAIHDNSGSVSPSFNLIIRNDLNIGAASTLIAGAHQHTFYGTQWVNNGTFTSIGSTVVFAGAAQTVNNAEFFDNLRMLSSGTSTKTFLGNLGITGNLEFANANATTLDISSYTSTIGGNISVISTGTHTLLATSGAFNVTGNIERSVSGLFRLNANTAIAGDINLTGSATLHIGGTASTNRIVSVNNISIALGSVFYLEDLDANHSLTINGSLTNNGTFDMYRSVARRTDVSFGAGLDRSISGTPTLVEFYNLTLNAGAGEISLSHNMPVLGNIIINNGSELFLNGRTLTTSGDITINAVGELHINDNAQLLVANGRVITNLGRLRLVGTLGNPAILDRNASGNYTVNQSGASAEFFASYYEIRNTGGTGLSISNGTINPTHNFNNGVFTSGVGTQYLNLTGVSLGAGITVSNVIFNTGPTYSISRTSGTGAITLEDASGVLAGENFDNDNGNPGTLILWTFPGSTFYSQGTNLFSVNANWNRIPGGGGANPIEADFTSGLASFVIQNTHVVTLDRDIDVLRVTVGGGASGTLTIGNNTTARTFNIRELLTVNNGANLNIGAFNATHQLLVNGNITNNGTFSMRNSSVQVCNFIIQNVDAQFFGTTTPTLNHLTFQTNTALTSAVALNIRGNVDIATGATFHNNGLSHQVGGNWTEAGTGQLSGLGTIQFNSNTTQLITSTATFNHITFNGGGVATINGAIIVNGNFSLANNTTVSTAISHNLAGNFSVASGSAFSHTAGTITFDGAGTQAINLDRASFNALAFSNGGSNAKTLSGQPANPYILGLMTVNTGATIAGSADLTIAGGINIAGTSNLTGSVTLTGGNINDSNDNSLSLGSASLNIAGTVYLLANKALSVPSSLSINSGTLTLADGATISGNASFDLILGSGASMNLDGVDNFPTGFNNYNLHELSTTRFRRVGDQTVRGGMNYGNLVLDGTAGNIKTLESDIDIDGTTTLSNGIVFNLAGHSISAAKDINNGGAAATINGGGNLVLDANDINQTIQAGIYQLNDLSITLGSPTLTRTKTIGSPISLAGNFFASNGSGTPSVLLIIELGANLMTASGTSNFTLGDNVQMNTSATTGASSFREMINSFGGAKSLDEASTISYNRNGIQDLADGFAYGNLLFGNTGNKVALGPLDINGNIQRTGGTPAFVDGGFTHTVAGDFALTTAYYPSPSGTVVIDGIIQNISASNFQNLQINNTGIASLIGSINLLGNLIINDGANLDATTYSITIDGNWDNSGSGIFTQTTGTVTFDGTTANQTIESNSNSYFGNFVINKSNPSFQTVSALTDLDFNRSVTLTLNNAIFDFSNQTIYAGDNWTVNVGSSIIAPNSSIVFDGPDLQSIRHEGSGSYNDWEFTGAGIKRFINEISGAIDIDGDFTISASTVDASWDGNWRVNFTVGGDWSNNGSFNHTGRTLTFDGANQSISASSFGNLVFAGSDTKTLLGNISPSGNLTISDGVTLDVSGANYGITLGGNWNNSGTGIFEPQNGTVTFTGNTSTVFTGGTGLGKRFYNFTVNSTGAIVLGGELEVANDLTIASGTFRTDVNSLTLRGNFDNSATFDHNNNASIITLAASSGTKTIKSNGSNFRSIVVNATGVTYLLTEDLNITGGNTMVLNDGLFRLNGRTLSFLTNATLERLTINGGIFHIDEGSQLLLADNNSVLNAGGIFRVLGIEGNPATVGRNTAGGYTISQTSGTFEARYYWFQNTEGTGITISGGNIDASNNFTSGTFSAGAGSQYLNLSGFNLADMIIDDVVFNPGPTYNVARTSGTGILNFTNSSGGLAGESYDNDDASPGTLILWTYPDGFFWIGADGVDNTDWHLPTNWLGNTVPTDPLNDLVYLNHDEVAGPYTVSIKSNNAIVRRLIIDAQGSPNAITLELQGGYDLTTGDNINIGANTVLQVLDANSALNINGAWSNLGTFIPGSGTVSFTGTTGIHPINAGTAAGRAFNHFTVSGTATYILASDLDINGNLFISDGKLDASTSNFDVYLAGNWLNSGNGVFDARSADVYFDQSGISTQTIQGGPFYNVELRATAGPNTKQLLASVGILRRLTISANAIFDAGAFNVQVGENWINNSSTSALVQSGVGTIIFNGTNQTIDNGSFATSFNHLTFAGGNTKTFTQSSIVNGNLLISNGVGAVNFDTYQINGNGVSNQFTIAGNTTVHIRGANNFPTGFETINIASNSTVDYRANIDQSIYPTTYGNLRLLRESGVSPTIKTALGDIEVLGTLTINDNTTTLDMATHDVNLTLYGNFAMAAGGMVNWGTGNSTLYHLGTNDICDPGSSSWCIDTDITGFNNLVLGGSRNKVMNGNLTITGNVTVQGGVTLNMRTSSMTGDGTGIFTLGSGAILSTEMPSPAIAFPSNFTFIIDPNSTANFNSLAGVNQIIYTGVSYGNVYCSDEVKNVTTDGVTDLDINGIFDTRLAVFQDAGRNFSVGGATVSLNGYVPSSPSITLTLDGVSQTIRSTTTNTNTTALNLGTLIFAGSGTKTLGDNNDVITIQGDITINNNVDVTSARNIDFQGAAFANNGGAFLHSANTFTFNRATAQSINPGSDNQFANLLFTGGGAKTFTSHGADVNGTLTVDLTNTLDFGALDYQISGTITNNGTWTTSNANITLDGGNQTITSPSFVARDIVIEGTGTKTMGSHWQIRNLTINSATLNATPTPYNISLSGSWNNLGGNFTANDNTVTFDGSSGPIDIVARNSSFAFVVFNPGAAVSYNLQSATTSITRDMTLQANATLNLNANRLNLGSNVGGGKNYSINGTLNVNDNAILSFDNRSSQCIMNVAGTLLLVGSSGNSATITRHQTGVAGAETQINITTGTIQARYYLIEYLSDEGFVVASGATLHPTNNFSDGVWSNIRTTAGTKRYLTLNMDATGVNNIVNVTFNFTGTPTAGVHYNVRRDVAATGTITFDPEISGNLGEFQFEDDGSPVSATAGNLRWPGITSVAWVGTINTNWHEPNNWLPNTVPTASINATVPLATNNPVISFDHAECKNLTLTNGQLSIQGDYDLEVTGDLIIGTGTSAAILSVGSSGTEITVGGSWTKATNGIFQNGSGTVIFNSATGAATITPLVTNGRFHHLVIDNSASEFFLAGATINVDGNLTIQSGILTPTSGNYTLNVGGDLSTIGSFNSSVAGKVVLNGAAQVVSGGSFYNLEVSGTSSKVTINPITIVNTLVINSILDTDGGSVLDIGGNVTINASGKLIDGGNTHQFGGAIWTGLGDYEGTGTVVFDRAGNQTLYASKFNNLIINNAGSVLTLEGDVEVMGDLTINSSVNYVNLKTFQITNTTGLGTFTLETGKILYVRGENNFPDGFTTYDLQTSSRVIYAGTGDQEIYPTEYYTLELTGASTKTLGGNIVVRGNVDINNSTLDVSNNDYSINLSLGWINNTTGTFIPRGGEVIFEGTGNQSITLAVTATNPFNRVTVNKTSGQVSTNSNLTIASTLQITEGIFTANGRTVTISEDMIAVAGTFANSGTYVLNKPAGIALIQTNGSILSHLTLDGASTEFDVTDDLTVYGNFYLDNGTFDGNSNYISLGNGADVVSISGYFRLGDGGTLGLGDNTTLTVENSGTIEIIGSVISPARVTRNSTNNGRYSFLVNGTILASNYIFEYFEVNGISLGATSIIDVNNNFSNGTFTNGAGNGVMLKIENTQTLTGANRIENVSFPIRPVGASSNVAKISAGSGELEFYNATGIFAGESYDQDPNDLIDWTGPVQLTWTGAISTDWFNVNNWSASSGPAIVPTGAEDVIIPSVVNAPLINTAGALTANLTISNGGSITITTADNDPDLTVNGDLQISGSLFTSSTNDIIEVFGSWQNTGGTVALNGLVSLRATGGSKTINNGTGFFGDLEINASTSYQLASNTNISGNLTISAGSLDISSGNRTLFIGGGFTNNGTFLSLNGKVVFNASSGTHTIDIGPSSNFFDLEINAGAAAVYELTSSTWVRRNTSIISGTLDLNGQEMEMGSNTGTPFISVSGALEIDANAHLRMSNTSSLTVNNGGELRLLGSDVNNRARISRRTSSTGYYSLSISSGGTLAANFYTVEYTNVNGLHLNAGAHIDTDFNLSNGVFSNGFVGGTFMKIENDLNLGLGDTINNLTFNTGPAYNISRTLGAGILLVFDAEGALGNYLYELDDEAVPSASSGLLEWNYTFPLLSWTGSVDNDFNEPNNWNPVFVPDNTTNLIVPDVSGASNNFPIIGTNAAARNLTVLTDANILINADADIVLDGELNVVGTFTVDAASNSLISVGTQFNNSGVFVAGASTLEFTAIDGIRTINTNGASLHNVRINGAGTFQPASNLVLSGDFEIASGTFDVSSSNFQISVAGDWVNNATFVPRAGTVVLNGANGTQIVTAGTAAGLPFYNLTKSTGSASTLSITTDLDINNNLIVQSGSVNANSNTLYVSGNWNFSGTSTFSDGSVVFDGSVTKTFTSTVLPQFTNLTMNKTGGSNVILNNPLRVNGNLNLGGGDLVLGSRVLTLGLTGEAVGASGSSYVQANGSGSVRKLFNSAPSATVGFPVGDASSYTPFAFTLNSATLAPTAYISVNVSSSAHPTIATITPATIIYLNRYWSLNQVGITDPDYDFEANYIDADVQPDLSVEASFVAAKYSTNTTPNWTKGGGVDEVSNTIFWNGVTSFSDITGVGEEEELPVELVSFKASLQNEHVKLDWKTLSETNNDYFGVERSSNGFDFIEIGRMQGAGTSRSFIDYAFIDENPLQGLNYYRLKQTDFDGKFAYSDVVGISLSKAGLYAMSIYPNPVEGDKLNLSGNGYEKDERLTLIVTNIVGQSVMTKEVVADDQGVIMEELAVGHLKKGTYIITLQSLKGLSQEKIVIK